MPGLLLGVGVAENILGRVLDAFWATLTSLAGAHTSFRLAWRHDVALAQVGGMTCPGSEE